MNRLLFVILTVFLVINFVSCGENNNITQVETTKVAKKADTTDVKMGEGTLSVFFSISDSLNPYKAVTAGNQYLSSLLFDPLVKLDKNLDAKLKLAQSVETKGKKCTVNLKDIKFSDGSYVTAEDVTYSLACAKESDLYKRQLENIVSFVAASSKTVEITLKHADRFVSFILDFPIIKRGSTGRENKDSKQLPPIGAGRYVYNDNSGVYTLRGNEHYYGKKPENIINLVNTPDSDSLNYYLKINEVDFYYSGVDVEDLPTMSGKISKVKLTNLIYLGINSNNKFLNNKYLRQSLSYLINRQTLCSDGYYNYAQPAYNLFNNSISTRKIFESKENLQKAIEQIKSGGYNKTDASGYFINDKNQKIRISLLYNKESHFQSNTAALIEKQLKKGGIDVDLNGVTFKQYQTLINKGRYDFYLGEVKLNKNFDLTSFFESNLINIATTATTTTSSTTENDDEIQESSENHLDEQIDMGKVYSDFLENKITTDKFIDIFSEQMPLIPIAYRVGINNCSSKVYPEAIATISDAYYNIELLSVK